jgi:prolyl oligopeptidase
VPRVQGGTAGGSVAWSADGRGFWHTRYLASGERAGGEEHFWQQVYFHALGTPAESDVYALGRELPKIAEIALQTSDDGAHLLVDVRNGDGGEHAFWLREGSGEFRQVARFEDAAVEAKFGDSRLYLLSRRASPNGAVLGVSYDDPVIAHARTVVAAGDTAIESIEFARGRLYTIDIVGGPSAVRIFDPTGRALGGVPLPPVCSVGGLVETSDETVLLSRSSFTQPPAWFRFDPARRTLTPTELAMKSPADFSDVEVRRELAVSKDGTKVPVNILMRKGTPLDGTAPALLTGYGGYGLSQRPSFNPQRRLWLDQGGIYVVANLRGGGEFGDAWHRAGNLTKKQNVFDDFAACAKYLCERRYTSPERLACQGGSNGGLLMGAMLVQHPEQVRAVVSSVGIYDMLRVEGTPNGLFNVTEFGTVKDSAQFEALYAYSPYHHVREGVKYPAVLFTTGANDPRVDPANSRKMTARLQAASASGHPVLLRTSGNVGHGIGSPLSERNALQADVFLFLLTQLGMRFIPPPPAVAP